MRFVYRDLGRREKGARVRVRLQGSSANVVLLDAVNFKAYRAGRPFLYHGGGLCCNSPAELTVPHEGRWFVAIDLGGYDGRLRAAIEVPEDGAAQPAAPAETVSRPMAISAARRRRSRRGQPPRREPRRAAGRGRARP